jgi:hypothetical protein
MTYHIKPTGDGRYHLTSTYDNGLAVTWGYFPTLRDAKAYVTKPCVWSDDEPEAFLPSAPPKVPVLACFLAGLAIGLWSR